MPHSETNDAEAGSSAGASLRLGVLHGYDPPPTRPEDLAVPPGFRFVDPHVHLFDHSVTGLSWRLHDRDWDHPRLKGAWRLDADRFSIPQYRSVVAGLNVTKVVHVQAADPACGPRIETAWLQGLSDRYGWPNGLLGPCDLASASAPRVLAVQAEHSAFRGIRDLGDGSTIGNDDWLRGYAALRTHGGTCDLWVSHESFDRIGKVAETFPDSVLVLEHCGLPVVSKIDSYFGEWRSALRRLSSHENVVVKISALSSAALPMFFAESIRHWVWTCIDLFGPKRCMFASNWPVDNLFTTYPRLLAVYRQLVEECAPGEQDDLFAGTAERTYRI